MLHNNQPELVVDDGSEAMVLTIKPAFESSPEHDAAAKEKGLYPVKAVLFISKEWLNSTRHVAFVGLDSQICFCLDSRQVPAFLSCSKANP